MDSPKIIYKYYSNPAFCGQSEGLQKCRITPDRRMPPLGANSPRKSENNRILRTDISDNPLRIINGRNRDEPPELPPKPAKFQNFHRQSSLIHRTNRSSVRSRTRSEDLEMAQFRQERRKKYDRNAESDDGLEDSRYKHRYEVIDDDIDYSPTKKRIVEAPAEEIREYNVDGPDDNELKEIPTEIVKTVNGKTHRYAIVPSDDDLPVPIHKRHVESERIGTDNEKRHNVTFTSPIMSKKHLIATQKLHELLSTPPRKLTSYASQPSVRITPNKSIESPKHLTPKQIISSTPTKNMTPSKSCANLSVTRGSRTSPISPKIPQKLNYGYPEGFERHDVFVTSIREKNRDRSFERESQRNGHQKDKTTAVISPRVASPPSTYSEETYPALASLKAVNAATASLSVAALMLTLCGGLSTGLSFYMMYSMGRRYYLDFSVLSGFTCFLLGMLGLRCRRQQLLPNRNFISGYIVLSTFSLLAALGLLILLSVQPKPGTALSDVTSGAVCAVSILCLIAASVGAIASFCCIKGPPDNRVGTTKWY